MARNSYGIAKRSIWYVLRTLIITAAIVALCLGVFIEGLHISNLYILVTEGMEKRTEAILKYGQTGVDIDLTPYFSEEYLNNDHELDSGKYAGSVRSRGSEPHRHRLKKNEKRTARSGA